VHVVHTALYIGKNLGAILHNLSRDPRMTSHFTQAVFPESTPAIHKGQHQCNPLPIMVWVPIFLGGLCLSAAVRHIMPWVAWSLVVWCWWSLCIYDCYYLLIYLSRPATLIRQTQHLKPKIHSPHPSRMKLPLAASLALTVLALADLAVAGECFDDYDYCGSNLLRISTAVKYLCRAAFADARAKTNITRRLWKLLARPPAKTARATR
jgi:hypothetical protein